MIANVYRALSMCHAFVLPYYLIYTSQQSYEVDVTITSFYRWKFQAQKGKKHAQDLTERKLQGRL